MREAVPHSAAAVEQWRDSTDLARQQVHLRSASTHSSTRKDQRSRHNSTTGYCSREAGVREQEGRFQNHRTFSLNDQTRARER